METVTLSNPNDLIYDKRKDDWKLLEDAPLVGTPTLELAEFLRDGESYVESEVMLSRAKELGDMAGQQHVACLLAMASQIPESWRGFYLVFPGTVWLDARGRRDVLCLDWLGDKWILCWYSLLDDGDVRLVRLGK